MTVEVSTRVTQYQVNALPESILDAHHWDVTVEYRGDGKWAICHFRQCLGDDGEWDFEPSPSSRTDEWLATHRFTEEEALRLAREQAPNITVNGLTPADVIARHN